MTKALIEFSCNMKKRRKTYSSLDDQEDIFEFPSNVFSKLVNHYLEQAVNTDFSAAIYEVNCDKNKNDSENIAEQLRRIDPEIVANPLSDLHIAYGQLAFSRGESAVVVLCGGMATRFGGTVKALVEIFPGIRFLDIVMNRIFEISSKSGELIPTIIITGPESHRSIAAYITERWPDALTEGWLYLVPQRIFPRIKRDGTLLETSEAPLFYPLGHGDVLFSIIEHGIINQLASKGVRYLSIWGIDNLLAGPEAKVLGAHIRQQKKITIEVVNRVGKEAGGHILNRSGRIECIEDFRLNAAESIITSPLQNTNSMVIDLDIFNNLPELSFFTVEKNVNDQIAIQFERLLGEITHYIDSHFLLVERKGMKSRFAPIKTEEDKIKLQPFLYELLINR
ncbi:MAG: hypothetical protein D3913_08830 [Candidatus Electrothrix sp. LOE1_4_5]|nr:hypothetical protein [Candidatus Electrothrix gigas]